MTGPLLVGEFRLTAFACLWASPKCPKLASPPLSPFSSRRRPRSLPNASLKHSRAESSASTQEPVRSLQNPRVKNARSLLRRRPRAKDQRLLLEGHRLVLDAVDAGHVPETVFYTEEALLRGEYGGRLRVLTDGGEAILCTEEVIASISDTVTPQGCVAVFRQPRIQLPEAASLDPGNVGTLLRAAAGAGVHGVILSAGCADAWGLKALRAGMGAQLRLPVLTECAWPDIRQVLLERYGCTVCVADGDSEGDSQGDSKGDGDDGAIEALQAPDVSRRKAVEYWRHDWTQASALIVGSEGGGPCPEAHEIASTRVSIPMANGTESLNAAVAGAVILFEASRQRAANQAC